MNAQEFDDRIRGHCGITRRQMKDADEMLAVFERYALSLPADTTIDCMQAALKRLNEAVAQLEQGIVEAQRAVGLRR